MRYSKFTTHPTHSQRIDKNAWQEWIVVCTRRTSTSYYKMRNEHLILHAGSSRRAHHHISILLASASQRYTILIPSSCCCLLLSCITRASEWAGEPDRDWYAMEWGDGQRVCCCVMCERVGYVLVSIYLSSWTSVLLSSSSSSPSLLLLLLLPPRRFFSFRLLLFSFGCERRLF